MRNRLLRQRQQTRIRKDTAMRKASREMDSAWALEVMRKAPYITVSFTRPDGTAYGVPAVSGMHKRHRMVFPLCPEGDKLDAIAAHPDVCLSAVTRCQPTVGPKDGSFTLQYRSAIAFGRAGWWKMKRRKQKP